MKRFWTIGLLATVLTATPAMAASTQWDQAAAALADEISAIVGPGQAHIVLRNMSTIPTEDIPTIRRLIEQDLKAHGVLTAGADSANTIRITLSENLRERLWVAEIMEGNETRVAMVHVDKAARHETQAESGVTLHKQTILVSSAVVLALLQSADTLVAIEPEEIVLYAKTSEGWREQKSEAVGQKRQLARDPRAVILAASSNQSFEAFLAGMECAGNFQSPDSSARCHESDDPWPILSVPASNGTTGSDAPIKAFYNASRNYFTGVVTPSLGVDLPPFYSAVLLPRSDGAGLLFNGIDGRVQLAEHNAVSAIAGTRDWGSDFAVLRSACGSGTQVVASGSGAAASDSLRAYELPALEAIPVSAPLDLEGTVTALSTAPDGNGILSIVQTASGAYEVDRVTATCN